MIKLNIQTSVEDFKLEIQRVDEENIHIIITMREDYEKIFEGYIKKKKG